MTYANTLDMFRNGLRTDEIAQELCRSEASVYNEIARLRESERLYQAVVSVPVPPLPKSKPKLVAYAGRAR